MTFDQQGYSKTMRALLVARSFFDRVVCEGGDGRLSLRRVVTNKNTYPAVSLELIDSENTEIPLPTLEVRSLSENETPAIEFFHSKGSEVFTLALDAKDSEELVVTSVQEQTEKLLSVVSEVIEGIMTKGNDVQKYAVSSNKPLPLGKDLKALEAEMFGDDDQPKSILDTYSSADEVEAISLDLDL